MFPQSTSSSNPAECHVPIALCAKVHTFMCLASCCSLSDKGMPSYDVRKVHTFISCPTLTKQLISILETEGCSAAWYGSHGLEQKELSFHLARDRKRRCIRWSRHFLWRLKCLRFNYCCSDSISRIWYYQVKKVI